MWQNIIPARTQQSHSICSAWLGGRAGKGTRESAPKNRQRHYTDGIANTRWLGCCHFPIHKWRAHTHTRNCKAFAANKCNSIRCVLFYGSSRFDSIVLFGGLRSLFVRRSRSNFQIILSYLLLFAYSEWMARMASTFFTFSGSLCHAARRAIFYISLRFPFV